MSSRDRRGGGIDAEGEAGLVPPPGLSGPDSKDPAPAATHDTGSSPQPEGSVTDAH